MASGSIVEQLKSQLESLDASDAAYATRFVDSLLEAAQNTGASDVHLTPNGTDLDVQWRLDGVLQIVGRYSQGLAADAIARLKVMAELLTYRTDVPQEGRVRAARNGTEMRVSTFPTLHGERAVVRLFARDQRFDCFEDLQFPGEISQRLQKLLFETSGALIISGPAGSGKTTTAYTCLRELVRQSDSCKSMISLEDPIEICLPGVAQSQVNPAAGFDLATGLRSVMRQDPEVILIGEIRDRETAETAFQASLTGHLIISTFHAGSAAEAVSRLADMGIEPYLLRSGILAILSQRLLRRLCCCAVSDSAVDAKLGLRVDRVRSPVGCDECLGTGYRGRLAVAELLTLDERTVSDAVLRCDSAADLQQAAVEAGMVSLWQRTRQALEQGLTSPREVRRVMGFSHD